MVAAVKGYRSVFVMAEDMSEERKQILKSYGGEVILTPAEQGTLGAIEEARRLEKEKGYFLSGSTSTRPTRRPTSKPPMKFGKISAPVLTR